MKSISSRYVTGKKTRLQPDTDIHPRLAVYTRGKLRHGTLLLRPRHVLLSRKPGKWLEKCRAQRDRVLEPHDSVLVRSDRGMAEGDHAQLRVGLAASHQRRFQCFPHHQSVHGRAVLHRGGRDGASPLGAGIVGCRPASTDGTV